MVAETPDWSYWSAVADTHVKLSRCIALSLNINPHLVPPHYIDKGGLPRYVNKMGFPRHIDGIRFPDWKSLEVFRTDFLTRLRILAAYRQNGECFSADTPGSGERSVMLREFARWASQRFTEPPIPKELAVLAAIGDRLLPAPQELSNMVAAGHTQSADVDLGEKAIAKAANPPETKSQLTRIRIEKQYAAILQAICDLEYVPLELPKKDGIEGVKGEVWTKVKVDKILFPVDPRKPQKPSRAFLRRWDELLHKKIEYLDQKRPSLPTP